MSLSILNPAGHGQVGWIARLVSVEEKPTCDHAYVTRKPRPVGGGLSLGLFNDDASKE